MSTHECEVVDADRASPPREEVARGAGGGKPGFQSDKMDLVDVDKVAEAMSGAQAVVDVGAIPGPNRHADEVVFGNNTRATFAVLQAAHLSGVRKAVIASSISALGPSFSPEPTTPLYAPVDEDHPLLGADPYAPSKEVAERTAAMFHRPSGRSVPALRFSFVARPDEVRVVAARVRRNPPGHTLTVCSYVGLRDAASATRRAI